MEAQVADVAISGTDDLTSGGGETADRTRRLGEYKPTNTPLPAAELEERMALSRTHHKLGWTPRTTQTIHDIVPIAEHKPLDDLAIVRDWYRR